MHLIVYDLASSNAILFSLEFETIEAMKLSMLYDLVEWVAGSGVGVGSN